MEIIIIINISWPESIPRSCWNMLELGGFWTDFGHFPSLGASLESWVSDLGPSRSGVRMQGAVLGERANGPVAFPWFSRRLEERSIICCLVYIYSIIMYYIVYCMFFVIESDYHIISCTYALRLPWFHGRNPLGQAMLSWLMIRLPKGLFFRSDTK